MTEAERDALSWFVTLRGTIREERRIEFAAWLAADPAHAQAYDAVENLWREMDGAVLRAHAQADPGLARLLARMDAAPPACPQTPWIRRALAATAAGLCAAAIAATWLFHPTLLQDLTADHIAARGERREIDLPDGSKVLLEADSALKVAFDPQSRRVTLLRGAGFFSVRADGRPFSVAAGNGETRVMGTRFEVRLLSRNETRVVVEDGRVRVQGPDQVERLLVRNQQVRYSPEETGGVAPADPADALAWRQGRLVFYDSRFVDVVAALERYRPGRIVILDDSLKEKRITGSFSADDPNAALASLQSIVGFELHDIAGRLALLR